MDILKTLKTVGLNEKEALVYKAILENGPSSPQEISRLSGLKRPTTYVILSELVYKGISFLIPYSQKKIYRVISPEELLKKVEEKIKIVREQLPELQALQKSETEEKPYVLFFDGVDGIKQIMDYKLEEVKNGEILHFMSTTSKKVIDLFEGFAEYNEELLGKNISVRGISPNDPILKMYRKEDEEYNRQVKELNLQEYKSNVSIEIGKTWVKMADFYNLQGIVIQNKTIAESLKQIFEMTWKRLEK